MTERYFVAEPISAEQVVLTGPEAHHMQHVMRAKVGDQVVLFDGGGDEFQAVVSRIGPRAVELKVLARVPTSRELPFQLTIVAPLPKGNRQKWLIEKAVELGVTKFIPLVTNRTIVRPSAEALVRLRRTVVEASKQCGRNRLMEIAAPQHWADVVTTAQDDAWRVIAHPSHESNGMSNDYPWAASGRLPLPLSGEKRRVIAAVGPEGGFDEMELTMAVNAGWQVVGLGPRVLRLETAVLLLTAWLIFCVASAEVVPTG